MPRETKDISLFNAGIVTAPDLDDIPDDAAAYSLDVENDAEWGKLIGRKKDEDWSAYYGHAPRSAAFIQRTNGKTGFVWHDSSNLNNWESLNSFDQFEDLQTDPGFQQPKLLPVGSQTCMVAHNQEVHIGTGSGELNKPQWMGFIQNGNLSGPAPTPMQIADAELFSPQALPALSKVVVDATYVYGFELDGSALYKINRSTGEIQKSDSGIFFKLRAICDEDATYLWVYDATASTNGSVLKVTKATLAIAATATLGSFTLESGAYISDMQATTNKIWLAAYKFTMSMPNISDLTVVTENWLWSVAKSAIPGTAITVTNNTPMLNSRTAQLPSTSPALGDFCVTINSTNYAINVPIAKTYPISLVKISATKVGWLVRVRTSQTVNVPGFFTVATTKWVDSTLPSVGLVTPSNVVFIVTEGDALRTREPIILMNDIPAAPQFTGVYYDSSSTRLYWTRDSLIYKSPAITLPTLLTTGSSFTVTSPTSASLTYNGGVCYEATESGDTRLFLTRIGYPPGVDYIKDDLTGQTVVLEGGQVSCSVAIGSVNSFGENKKYFYKGCFFYDGYQHSPLSNFVLASFTNGDGVFTNANITVTIRDIRQVPIRASHFLLWRASGTSDDTSPTEFYRLVKSVALDDKGWTLSSNTASYVVADEVEDIGKPYEAESGMPESLETSMVNYALATVVNGQMFVASCFKKELTDASHHLFRSKNARFDMFDWTNDFLRLPIIPTALASYGGRLWVFGKNVAYRVSPDGLYIEETFDGVGADNARAAIATEKGLFCCNKSNVWLCDGTKFVAIGQAIKGKSTSSLGAVSWADVAHTSYDPFLISAPKINSVLFCVSQGSGANNAFVFNYERGRWDYWELPTSAADTTNERTRVGGFTDPTGIAYFGQRYMTSTVASSTSRKALTWISRKFTFEDMSQVKKLYFIIPEVTGTDSNSVLTLSYAKDSGESFTTLASPYSMPANDRRIRAIQIKVVTSGSTAGNVKLRSLSTIYRHLFGKR